MDEVKIVAVTQPRVQGINTAEDFIAYAAKVSNPANQMNTMTAPKLMRYLVKNKHWSPFEMVDIAMEINTTRDIGRQILRHRSFSFQEFSQRYADVSSLGDMFIQGREARLQDTKNRQNSLDTDNDDIIDDWYGLQDEVMLVAKRAYIEALKMGIAKEQARVILPEGLTKTRMYMKGSLRSWIHYCAVRCEKSTQKEHRDIADAVWLLITEEFPSLTGILNEWIEATELKKT